MQNFTFDIPTKIFFGKGQIKNLETELPDKAHRVLIVYGSSRIKKNGLLDTITAILDRLQIQHYYLSGVLPNPRITSVREGIQICREHTIDYILAVGGGSSIDCAKAIAAGFYHEGDPWDFFIQKAEVTNALPLAAILTLAATGSEMNGNAVISNEGTEEKRAVGHDLLKPRFSILDPTYSMTVPRKHTAAGTVDIMSHVFEQYFSPTRDAFLQDRLAEAMLHTCITYAPIAMDEPDNYEARANLMWSGSLALNGLLAHGKITDWATHGIEHELSALYDITHGVGLAILTPHWMEYVLEDTNAGLFARYAKNVWQVTDENPFEAARAGIEETRNFFTRLGMPEKLEEVGITHKHFPIMAKKAVQFGPLGNLKKLEEHDVLEILKLSLR